MIFFLANHLKKQISQQPMRQTISTVSGTYTVLSAILATVVLILVLLTINKQ